MNEEKQYQKCYVAFLDVLGFKEMIKTKSCEYIYGVFSKEFKQTVKQIYVDTTLAFDMSNIKMKVMSDSICFFVDSSLKNSLFGLVGVIANFQNELLCFEEPVLTRGAIVHGDIFSEGDIIYGPAFVDAYLKEEKLAKYPRIILDEGLIEESENNSDDNVYKALNQFSLFDFDGNFVVDYWQVFNEINKNKYLDLLSYIEKVISENENESVVEKYKYFKSQLLRRNRPGVK